MDVKPLREENFSVSSGSILGSASSNCCSNSSTGSASQSSSLDASADLGRSAVAAVAVVMPGASWTMVTSEAFEPRRATTVVWEIIRLDVDGPLSRRISRL